MSRGLGDTLRGLLDAQFEELVVVLGNPPYIATRPAPRATRADELAAWIAQDPNRQATVAAWLEAQGQSPDAALKWRTFCLDRQRFLPILGFRDERKYQLPIDAIYVPLQVTSMEPARGPGADGCMGQESRVVEVHDALSALERRSVRGLALVGDPGCGKTTLLQHVFCQVSQEGSEALGLVKGLVPLFLRFSRFPKEVLATRETLSRWGLMDLVEREAELDRHPGAGRALVTRPDTRFLFLLDGLDEVRDDDERARVCAWLTDELDHWPGSRCLVTCRRAAWGRARGPMEGRFLTVEVLDLDEAGMERYIRAWFPEVLLTQRRILSQGDDVAKQLVEEEAEKKAGELVEVLKDPKRPWSLRQMARNPLLLSTICLVHHAIGHLPEARGQLYDECLGVLLRVRPDLRADAKRGFLGFDPRAAKEVLQPLAWAMQEALGDDGSVKEFTTAEILPHIAHPLSEIPKLSGISPETFLDRVTRECGVLRSHDFDRYQFFHLSFQEYLAAEDAARRGAAADLASRLGVPRWQEPILLAMSLPGFFGPFMEAALARDFVPHADLLGRCLDEADRVDHGPFVAWLTRATRPRGFWDRLFGTPVRPQAIAALLGLFVNRKNPDMARVAQRLLDHPDPQVAALARQVAGKVAEAPMSREPQVGDRWTDPVTGMEFVWVPAGKSTQGPRKVVLTRGFWLGRHPVTNAQYRRYVEEAGTEEPQGFRDSRFNRPMQPVVYVNWDEAVAFCRWLSARIDREVRLPTEAEWEWAATGGDGRRYPWGNEEPTEERACYGLAWDKGSTADVGGRPRGAGPFGAEDQAGNVWEWCRDVYADYPDVAEEVDPCHEGDTPGRENDRPRHAGDKDVARAPRVIRGGSWSSAPGSLRCADRGCGHPRCRGGNLGFRVVCVSVPQHGP